MADLLTIHIDRDRPRGNCRTCGSVMYPPNQRVVGERFCCPRCASEYRFTQVTPWSMIIERTTIQREYDRPAPGRKRPKKCVDEILADPVLAPIKRAQRRIAAAERDLAVALASANIEHGRSCRAIGEAVGLKKSRTAELIQSAAAIYAITPRAAVSQGVSADEIPF